MRAVNALMAVLLSSWAASAADVISGMPHIVDGDTVKIGQTNIRLEGIDAPETDQVCLDARGQKWACGAASREAMEKFSAARPWDCDITGADRYGRSLGKCFIEGDDVNQWMVRSGWALSFKKYSHQYDRDEDAARQSRQGLWSGAFIAPWWSAPSEVIHPVSWSEDHFGWNERWQGSGTSRKRSSPSCGR